MLMRLQTVVAVVLIAGTVAGWAVPSAAMGSDLSQTMGRSAAVARTTVVSEPAARDERSAPVIVVLVGLGAAAGVIVGVMPALVAALALGYLPPPRRRLRPAGGVLAEPPPGELGRTPAQLERPSAPAPAAAFAPAAPGAIEEPSHDPPPRQGRLAILAHARHQDVYDTAYAEQLERVGALRSAIGDRRRTSPEPPDDPGSKPPAKGTS